MDLEQTDSPAEKEVPGNAIGVNAMLEFQGSKSKGADSHTELLGELRRDRPVMLRSRYFSWFPNSAFEILNTFRKQPLVMVLRLKPLAFGGMLSSAVLSSFLWDPRDDSTLYLM
jgi:hypothetical protein